MPPKRSSSKAPPAKPKSSSTAGSKRAAASSSNIASSSKKRSSTGAVTATHIKEYPATFQCKSGYILWGHLHTVWTGATSTRTDSMLAEPEYAEGGTIASALHQYRTQARRGTWLVERLFMDGVHMGCIAHHEDVSAKELLLGSAMLGESRWPEQQIQRVGRYDWSAAYDGVATTEMVQRLKENGAPGPSKRRRRRSDDDDDDEDDALVEYLDCLRSRCCILLDADRFGDFKTMIRNKPRQLTQDGVCVFGEGESNVGVVYKPVDSEYEFAWMCYAEDGEEMVGFVYDAAYTLLENFDEDMSVEDTVVIKQDGIAVE
ncbi:uncharacterized protein EV422DRAFT_528211 [Fimicolochytrium jonesii]|uniref:uncharacterized protein n=1 Tax=Fimicolochytrium jonesii TaxID=1396493 RepID=UPI0022FDEA0F|nr:uncharacterized protein EV422DRAFT_528211 [Fimicolochytrium jonesii]KAI8821461.1 hypothetical protein EV422DRAFT_528211 [Fimicolochytrium jonesii]